MKRNKEFPESAIYEYYISLYCDKYNVPLDLAIAVCRAESDFSLTAKSHKGAMGLFQIIKSSWDWLCKDILKKNWNYDDCWDIAECNICVGIKYLSWLEKYFLKLEEKGESFKVNLLSLVVGAYNCGQNRVVREGYNIGKLPIETRNYIKRVHSYIADYHE